MPCFMIAEMDFDARVGITADIRPMYENLELTKDIMGKNKKQQS